MSDPDIPFCLFARGLETAGLQYKLKATHERPRYSLLIDILRGSPLDFNLLYMLWLECSK